MKNLFTQSHTSYTKEVYVLEKTRRMTSEEQDHYLHQVARRGKARELPPEKLEKWKEEYEKITAYLRENYKWFVCSKIARRKAYTDAEVFQQLIEEEKDGLCVLINQAVNEGNTEDLLLCCWWMHLLYMLKWKEAKIE